MVLNALVTAGRKLRGILPTRSSVGGFESRIETLLSQDSSPITLSKRLGFDTEGSITLTAESIKDRAEQVKKLAKLSDGSITFNEEVVDGLASSTRNETIAMVVSFCLSREDITSVIIPVSYWRNTKHPFQLNERTCALIVRSLGIPLDKVSFTKKGDSMEIRKK